MAERETKSFLMDKDDVQEVSKFLMHPEVQTKLAELRSNAGFGEILRRTFKHGWPKTQREFLSNSN